MIVRSLFPMLATTALAVVWAGGLGLRAAAAPPSSAYKLVFADEFNGSALDTLKWIDQYPWGRTHNHDAYMASSNVVFPGDGTVTLKADRVAQGGKAFTSGVISTGYSLEKFDGGYFEARMLLPTTPGSWPAFWGLDSGWPPEADIMEFPLTTDGGASGYLNTDYHTAWHYKNTSGGNSAGAGKVNPSSAGALNTAYHTFGMEWTSDTSAAFFFDGVQVSSFSNATAISQMTSMYLILNYAVGGWPGTPSLAQWAAGASDTTKIDYVRVYQKPTTSGTIAFSGTAAGGSWDTAARWSSSVPRFEDQVASFGSNSNPALALDWNQARTVGGLAFSSTTTSYTIGDASASLQFARSSGTPTISLTAGTTKPQTIAARVELYETTTAITNDSPQSLSLTGVIVGEGSLTVDGTGTVIFANNNTYTGDTTIDAGSAGPAVARVTRSRPFGTGTVTIGAAGNATTARLEIQDTRSVPNTIRFAGRANPTVGLLNLSGTNEFQGTVAAVTGGTSYIIQSDAGLMRFTATADEAGVALTSAATGNRTFTLQGVGRGEISGGITNGSGTVHLLKAGSGTWTLSGNTAHTGTTTVQAGTLRIAGARGLQASPTVVAGGTLAVDAGVIARVPNLQLVDGAVQASSVLVNGTSGIGMLEVQGGGFSTKPIMTVSGSGVVQLPASAPYDLQIGGLLIDQATGGRIDIGRSRITVSAGGIPQAAVIADLLAGRGGGSWNGSAGIMSSAAAAALAAGQPGAIGWMLNGDGSTAIAFAAAGDSNLDGVVDVLDVANFLGSGKYNGGDSATWQQGDFNYDGVVDILDVAALLGPALYDKGNGLSAVAEGAVTSLGDVAMVPEPATVVLVIAGVGIAALARSKRRRQPWAVSSLRDALTIRR